MKIIRPKCKYCNEEMKPRVQKITNDFFWACQNLRCPSLQAGKAQGGSKELGIIKQQENYKFASLVLKTNGDFTQENTALNHGHNRIKIKNLPEELRKKLRPPKD